MSGRARLAVLTLLPLALSAVLTYAVLEGYLPPAYAVFEITAPPYPGKHIYCTSLVASFGRGTYIVTIDPATRVYVEASPAAEGLPDIVNETATFILRSNRAVFLRLCAYLGPYDTRVATVEVSRRY